MTSRTHDLGAFAALITVYHFLGLPFLGWPTIITASIANIVGALLPDIDQASNRLWDLIPGGNLVGRILRKLFIAHRTLSHSILGIVIIYSLTHWVIYKIFNPTFVNPGIVFLSLMIGYLSHLILDSLTEEGIPLLFPIKWKFGFPPIKWMRIKTDHWFERWIIFPGLVIYIIGAGIMWVRI